LTPVCKVSDMPAKVLGYHGRTSTGVREQFWPEVLPASISDLHGYQWELNPGSLEPLNHGIKLNCAEYFSKILIMYHYCGTSSCLVLAFVIVYSIS